MKLTIQVHWADRMPVVLHPMDLDATIVLGQSESRLGGQDGPGGFPASGCNAYSSGAPTIFPDVGFTTHTASNNRTLTEVLTNAWSLLSVECCQLENHIPYMAHVVQLILSAFISSIKVKSQDGHLPSGFKAG